MRAEPGPGTHRRRQWFNVTEGTIRWLALAAVILIVGLVFVLRNRLPSPETVAYPAIFFLSLFASSTVFLPAPGILSVCSGGVLLNPFIVGIVAGIAEALGELTGYLAGFSGHGLMRKSRMYQRIQPWMRRRGWIVILVFASVPNPLFDIVGLAAGATRMPMWQFLGAAWAGKTAKSMMIAYGCLFGYDFFHNLSQAVS